jgi:uncharacterized protein YlxW (UPF0749 family)
MKQPRALLAVTIVAFVLGILLVMQLRAQNSAGGLEQLSSADLTVLIANLNDRNALLRTEVAGLEADLRGLQASGASDEGNVDQLRTDLSRLRLWAGLDPIQGRGIVVAVKGPITADAVNDLLDELRLAGAEAIAIEDVRVVAGTVVSGQTSDLVVEGSRLGADFEITAIGARPGDPGSGRWHRQPDRGRPTDVSSRSRRASRRLAAGHAARFILTAPRPI